MKIYLYDKKTLEFVKEIEADADPEETKLQGHFVPLVPANATTINPPEVQENEVAIFSGEGWIVYPDFRGKFFKVDENLELHQITTIGLNEGDVLVSKAVADEIRTNPQLFRISGKKLVRKSADEIEAELYQKRKQNFESQFFHTSLGWIRRKVNMKDGTTKDFLSDLLLSIKAGIEMGKNVNIIIYNQPDFSNETNTEYLESLQAVKTATPDFVEECLEQTVKDFGI